MGRLFSKTTLLFVYLTMASQAPSANGKAEIAAKTMVDLFVTSWNLADGSTYGKNYWPDAELVDPSGRIVDGRAAIVQEHVDLWAGPFKGTRIAGTVRRVQRLGPRS